jgi:hypothetical protein
VTAALQDYQLHPTRFPNLRILPLDVALARETALVRGETGLRTPDAIQVAAARLAGADATLCVTNDRRWAGRGCAHQGGSIFDYQVGPFRGSPAIRVKPRQPVESRTVGVFVQMPTTSASKASRPETSLFAAGKALETGLS